MEFIETENLKSKENLKLRISVVIMIEQRCHKSLVIIADLEAQEKSGGRCGEFDEACRRPAPLLLLGTCWQRGCVQRGNGV